MAKKAGKEKPSVVSPSETRFLEENDVVVTNSRFIVGAQVFAMSGVTSVKFLEDKPSKFGPVLVILIGLFFSYSSAVLGIPFIIMGVIWWANQKSTFYVVLNTSSGEAKALVSEDGKWIQKVINALNDSIIYRN